MVADLLLAAASMVWAANYGIVKGALTELGPLAFLFARFSAAAAVMGCGLCFVWPRFRVQRQHWALLMGASVGAALYQVAFMVGLQYTTSTNSALLFAATPVVVTVIARVMGTAEVRRVQALGMLLSFVGVYFVITGAPGAELARGRLAGDLITVASVLLWSGHIYCNTMLLRHYPSTPLTALELVIAWFLLLPLCGTAILSQSWSGVSVVGWGGLAYAVVGSTVIAYSFWNYGIRRIGPVRTLAYQYVTPVLAVVLGVFVFGEQTAVVQILGGALVLAGVLLVRLDLLAGRVG